MLQNLEGPPKSTIDLAKHGGHGKLGIPCEVEKVLGVDLDNVIEAELRPQKSDFDKGNAPKLPNESDSSTRSYQVSLMCDSCDFDTPSAEVLERHVTTAHGTVDTDNSTTNGEGGVDAEDAEMFKSTERTLKATGETKFSARRSFRKRTQGGDSLEKHLVRISA